MLKYLFSIEATCESFLEFWKNKNKTILPNERENYCQTFVPLLPQAFKPWQAALRILGN